MNYISTRGKGAKVSSAQAILSGIACDGGLFVPETIPHIDYTKLIDKTYKEMAFEILSLFFDDFAAADLHKAIELAYDDKFKADDVVTLKYVDGVCFVELFHGKTLAFKDVALSLLPYLMKLSTNKLKFQNEIVILTATSGDTGKAALEAFADVSGFKVVVLYPTDGVSGIQKLQMSTQQGKNVYTLAIKGNFDDAQNKVKEIFASEAMENKLDDMGMAWGSANSINIARLLPQLVYYFYSYAQMVKSGHINLSDKVDFYVPTGNFGNILAGYYAKKAGLPIGNLVSASNDNKVLYDFFTTGTYDINRDFHATISPSMDILISSNLERFLYEMSKDSAVVKRLMNDLKSNKKYDYTTTGIIGAYAQQSDVYETIKYYFEKGYLIDTHTAVAAHAINNASAKTKNRAAVLATASPFKFAENILEVFNETSENPIAAAEKLSALSGLCLPYQIAELKNKGQIHNDVSEISEVSEYILKFLSK